MGGKFRSQFVYSKLLARPGADAISSNPIKRGTKIITMTTQHNIIFKDTLLYMPCALKKLPKCIRITGDLAKGFFPYNFLKRETANYVGSISAREMFEIYAMDKAEKLEFDVFYNSFAHREYDIKAECTKYCVQDVDILRNLEKCL